MKDGKNIKPLLMFKEEDNAPVSNLDIKEVMARGDFTGQDKFLIERIQGARIDASVPKKGMGMMVWILIGLAVAGVIAFVVFGGK
jgi:hypothetical protein